MGFEASQLKVRRARKHNAELRGLIRRYSEAKHCKIVLEDAGSGFADWKIHVRRSPPDEIPAIIGDVIHNLRASLDLLACGLVRNEGGDVEHVYFPFAKGPDQIEYMIEKRGMLQASPAAVELLRTMKPYTGGNIALRAIHDLDIIDKHKSLIPTLSGLIMPDMRIGTSTFTGNRVSLLDGSVYMRFPRPGNINFGYQLIAAPRFDFPYDGPFAGSEIVPTLHELCDLTDGIIEAFASL